MTIANFTPNLVLIDGLASQFHNPLHVTCEM